IQFQQAVPREAELPPSSTLTVEPPARTLPDAICSAASANNSSLGNESASTKTNQSPVAAAAPLFRAREIWLIGSKTTVAPAAMASSAVRSVELLSHTISSVGHPLRVKDCIAFPTC